MKNMEVNSSLEISLERERNITCFLSPFLDESRLVFHYKTWQYPDRMLMTGFSVFRIYRHLASLVLVFERLLNILNALTSLVKVLASFCILGSKRIPGELKYLAQKLWKL